jgi:hypothetical protein
MKSTSRQGVVDAEIKKSAEQASSCFILPVGNVFNVSHTSRADFQSKITN